jgi:hypothetical protein
MGGTSRENESGAGRLMPEAVTNDDIFVTTRWTIVLAGRDPQMDKLKEQIQSKNIPIEQGEKNEDMEKQTVWRQPSEFLRMDPWRINMHHRLGIRGGNRILARQPSAAEPQLNFEYRTQAYSRRGFRRRQRATRTATNVE